MAVEMFESKSPTNATELDGLEAELGIRLPEPYRRFLLQHNGGYPEPASFKFKHGSDPADGSMVDRFLAVYKGPYNNFADTFGTFKVRDKRVPENLVPIARDPGGNLICIAVAGKDLGAVYFWDHEREADDGEEATYENCDLIADSFDEFLEVLYDPEAQAAQ